MELKQSESERSRQLLAKEQESKALKKELCNGRLRHRREMKDQEQKHTEETEAAWVACHDQKLAHQNEMDKLKIRHKEEMRQVRKELSQAVTLRQERIDKMESELVEYIETYGGMMQEYEYLQREAKLRGRKLDTVSNTSKQHLHTMRQLKENRKKMKG